MTKIRKIALVMMLVLICSVSVVFAQAVRERRDIKVIYTNDVHCGYKGEIGYAGLASFVKATKAENAYVTLVDSGDSLQGEVIGTVSNGEYLVDIMNYIGYDYGVFGNHEFDYGMDQLKKLISLSNVQYLASNISYSGSHPEDLAKVKAYDIVTYGDTKVAFVGVSTPESIVKSTPKFFQEDGKYVYDFASGNALYATVQYWVDDAKANGADYIVMVSHLGLDSESAPNRASDVIANTTGIDVVLDGHSHDTVASEVYKNKAGKDVVYSQTGTKFANVGVLTINRETGKISTELVQPKDQDLETALFIANIETEYEALVKAPVATSAISLLINREDGTRAVRNRETAIGDLCADAYRIVSGADIGFINGGGIRANINQGVLSRGDIISVHPFGNKLCVVEATGQEILDALEWGSKSTEAKASEGGKAVGEAGGFLQVSGLKYTIDTSIKSTCVADDKGMFIEVAGERRVKDVYVGTDETGYKPIDPNATYTLACHNYKLKDKGDGYTMFADNKILQDEVMIDNQLLITYIVDYLGGTITDQYAQPQGRITIK